MYQGIRQSDGAAKLNAFIWSGLDDEPGSYQIEIKQRYRWDFRRNYAFRSNLIKNRAQTLLLTNERAQTERRNTIKGRHQASGISADTLVRVLVQEASDPFPVVYLYIHLLRLSWNSLKTGPRWSKWIS